MTKNEDHDREPASQGGDPADASALRIRFEDCVGHGPPLTLRHDEDPELAGRLLETQRFSEWLAADQSDIRQLPLNLRFWHASHPGNVPGWLLLLTHNPRRRVWLTFKNAFVRFWASIVSRWTSYSSTSWGQLMRDENSLIRDRIFASLTAANSLEDQDVQAPMSRSGLINSLDAIDNENMVRLWDRIDSNEPCDIELKATAEIFRDVADESPHHLASIYSICLADHTSVRAQGIVSVLMPHLSLHADYLIENGTAKERAAAGLFVMATNSDTEKIRRVVVRVLDGHDSSSTMRALLARAEWIERTFDADTYSLMIDVLVDLASSAESQDLGNELAGACAKLLLLWDDATQSVEFALQMSKCNRFEIREAGLGVLEFLLGTHADDGCLAAVRNAICQIEHAARFSDNLTETVLGLINRMGRSTVTAVFQELMHIGYGTRECYRNVRGILRMQALQAIMESERFSPWNRLSEEIQSNLTELTAPERRRIVGHYRKLVHLLQRQGANTLRNLPPETSHPAKLDSSDTLLISNRETVIASIPSVGSFNAHERKTLVEQMWNQQKLQKGKIVRVECSFGIIRSNDGEDVYFPDVVLKGPEFNNKLLDEDVHFCTMPGKLHQASYVIPVSTEEQIVSPENT